MVVQKLKKKRTGKEGQCVKLDSFLLLGIKSEKQSRTKEKKMVRRSTFRCTKTKKSGTIKRLQI